MKNAFPICRTIFDHWIYCDAEYLKIWITMLGKARFKKEPKKGLWQGVGYTLNYGEFIFGRIQWSKNLNIGEQKIRTCIKKLIADNMVEVVEKKNKFTIYKVVNYEKYNQQDNQQQTQKNQQVQEYSNHQTNQQITSEQPADNQQITTKEECKESSKKEKNIYIVQSEQLWNLYPSKTGKATAIKKIPKLIKQYSYEQIERCISRYKQYVTNRQNTDFPSLKYQNGSTFFNSGYMDYLDENYKPLEPTGTEQNNIWKPKVWR